MVTLAADATPEEHLASSEPTLRASKAPADFSSITVPTRDPSKRCEAFASLEGAQRPFYPDIKVHTPLGEGVHELCQTHIPFASEAYRLRSDDLAQTLRLFGGKVARGLPEGFCVQVSLSPLEGVGATDTVSLIDCASPQSAQAIMEQHYLPFHGGGIGWIFPTDEARNRVLNIEERLFYYKSLLAINAAISNRLAQR